MLDGGRNKMGAIITVYLKEMLDTVRDRRTLLVMVLMPLVFMPLLTIGFPMLMDVQMAKSEQKVSVVGVVGEDNSPKLMSYLKRGANYSRIAIEVVDNLTAAIDDGIVKAGIAVSKNFDASVALGNVGNISIYYDSTNLASQTARDKIYSLLQGFRLELVAQRLNASGLNVSILSPFESGEVDISTEQERGGFFLGLMLPMMLGMFAAVGGMYTAIDVTAGEKERKTLERLLVAPASRLEIVMGKFLAVFTVSMVSVGISLFSMIVSAIVGGSFLFPEGGFAIRIPALTVVVVLGMAALLAIMVNSIEIAVCMFAKSFKEAQNYATPVTFVVILPAVLTMSMPGMEASLPMYAIPLVSGMLVFKDALLGSFVWRYVAMAVATSALYAAVALVVAVRLFNRESVLFRGGG